ncbi:MAG: family 43 glycosylhydrolase [Lachnospiraceae bacterium]|nr:family 43 glycosylhydrolase [Lachnospiraceae bacterium]
MKDYIKGANPYMPLWEHVPDGEPRVFEYGGEKRVYVYGSHDTMRTEYCGKDYVVWSAPVDDLTDWRYHGTCYETSDGSVLYAPDVVQKGDTFYLYSAEQKGSCVYVSESKSPTGPFIHPRKTELGFDPGILVDDDGRVYAYWGFCACYCCELNEDMATIREGTLHAHPMEHTIASWLKEDDGHTGAEDAFFEASSPRKVFGKYVYIYSKRYFTPVPELGVYTENNGFLSYKYSDSPLEGFQPGGDISFNGGEILKNPDGTGTMSYRWGNNHGSIMEINGKWYVFYHRQTGTDEYSRQAMLELVDVAMDQNGKIYIGDITYKNGEPVSSKPVEMTSQGAHINGLDAYQLISAGYACHLTDRRQQKKGSAVAKAYIRPVYEQEDTVSAPIVEITDGVTAGYRYLQFGANAPKTVTAFIQAKADLTVNVRMDDYRGRICAVLHMKAGESQATAEVTTGMIGRHAVYFEFLSESEGVIAEFERFTFDWEE